MSKKEEHFNKKDIQTHLKHILLDDYVTNWSSVLANASRGTNLKKVHYIDGFAGRGYFDDGNDGSPKIAVKRLFTLQQLLQEKYESSLRFYIHTIEYDNTYFEELNKIKSIAPYPSQISNYLGKFEDHLESLLKKTDGSPALYFIDPFGYKGVTMKDIKRILSHKSHEVLINVMSYSILRNSTIETSQIELCNFFGIDQLPENMQKFITKAREIGQGNLNNIDRQALNLEESIIDLYKKTITSGGNNEKIYILSKRIHSQINNNVYFHLVFATKNRRGLIEMKRSMVNFEKIRGVEEDKYIKRNQLSTVLKSDFFSENFSFNNYNFDDFIIDFLKCFNNKQTSYGDIIDYFLQHSELQFRSNESDVSIYEFIKKLFDNTTLITSSSKGFADWKNADNIIIYSNLPDNFSLKINHKKIITVKDQIELF